MPDELIRTSERERDQVIAFLSDHFALGRLTLDELNQRADQAFRATTRAQLEALLLDLPADATASPPAPNRPSPNHSPSLLRPNCLTSWAVTAIICLVIWLGTSIAEGSALYFWPAWVIGPWGVATAARAFYGGGVAQLHRRCRL